MGELGEIRERTGIAAEGDPAGAPGATGVERPGREWMFNGWAAACGEEMIVFFEGIARFGDILNIDGPLVEIEPRSVFVNPAVGGWQ